MSGVSDQFSDRNGNHLQRRRLNLATAAKRMRLIDLIDKKPCSLRLKLPIRGASMRGELPANTVGEYLALGDSAPTEFQKLYDLGPKIARELDRTITTFMNRSLAKDRKTRVATANRDAADNNAIDGASASTLRALEAALKKAPLPKVLFGKNISTSLHNMLQLNVGLRGIEWESFAAEGLIKRCIV